MKANAQSSKNILIHLKCFILHANNLFKRGKYFSILSHHNTETFLINKTKKKFKWSSFYIYRMDESQSIFLYVILKTNFRFNERILKICKISVIIFD